MFDGRGPPKEDVFEKYLAYTAETEPPTIYHRWSYLTTLGAAIGRKAWIVQGHGRIFGTLYVQLIGEPATRKSTAIKMAKKLFSATGYSWFSGDKTTKEKFLEDLEGITEDITDYGSKKPKLDAVTAEALWGSGSEGEPREVFVVADEFNDYAGAGNLEFYTTLGNLWDWDDPNLPFKQRLKSKSISIFQPTISILSGNTPELFSKAFPPESIGSGFLSRLLLIYGERSGRRITFPPPPDAKLQEILVRFLQRLNTNELGEVSLSVDAKEILHDIYQTDISAVDDIRFKGYNNRRFTHLLRICLILSASKFVNEVTKEDVIQANTILSHAELLMPKALGEFGKNKNSDIADKVMQVVDKATKPINIREIWSAIGGISALAKMSDLSDMLEGMVAAQKLQLIHSAIAGNGFLPKKKERREPKHVDWNFLTQEERDML